MAETGRFNIERLTPRLLASTYHAGRAVARGTDISKRGTPSSIQAYMGLLKTPAPDWYEVALAYVDEEHQGNGVGGELLDEILAKRPGVRFFAISQDAVFHTLVARRMFTPVTRLVMFDVVEWAEHIGLGRAGEAGCRLPETALRWGVSKPRDGERWLFIR